MMVFSYKSHIFLILCILDCILDNLGSLHHTESVKILFEFVFDSIGFSLQVLTTLMHCLWFSKHWQWYLDPSYQSVTLGHGWRVSLGFSKIFF